MKHTEKKNRPLGNLRGQKGQSCLLRFAVWFSAILTAMALFFVVAYILIKGSTYLRSSFFAWYVNS